MPLFTPDKRARMADQVAQLLRDDGRVEGVVLVGSLAGTPDRWSDVDLEAVVADESEAEVATVAADWVDRMYDALPVVHHFETAFGHTLVRGFLLDDALEVDVAFAPTAEFSLWDPFQVLFDRSGRIERIAAIPSDWQPGPPDWSGEAGFAWHDVLHACTATRRDRTWQALWYLERVRNRTLTLAQQRRGFYAEFFDYVDDLPAQELTPHAATLVASLDPRSLLGAIDTATRLFLDELRRGGPDLAERLERPLLDVIRGDDQHAIR
jgi:predicted nucleotidyltransferase